MQFSIGFIFLLLGVPATAQVGSSESDELHVALSSALVEVYSSNSQRDSIVEYAKTLLGIPYKYGGSTKDAFDCSGFTCHVYHRFGYQLPRTSRMQGLSGVEIARDAIRPGDLVVFTGTNVSRRIPGHVGIITAVDGDTIHFIHASSGKRTRQVTETTLTSYYESRLLGFRRIVG